MSAPFERELIGGDMYSMQIWNHLQIKSEPSRWPQNKFKLEMAIHTESNKNQSNQSALISDRILWDTVGFLSPLHIVENQFHLRKNLASKQHCQGRECNPSMLRKSKSSVPKNLGASCLLPVKGGRRWGDWPFLESSEGFQTDPPIHPSLLETTTHKFYIL